MEAIECRTESLGKMKVAEANRLKWRCEQLESDLRRLNIGLGWALSMLTTEQVRNWTELLASALRGEQPR